MKIPNLKFRLVLLLVACIFASGVAWGQSTPSQDSYTNSADSNTNYGTATTLNVASTTTATQTAYIQFDLSAVPSSYTGANVAKATLKLYVNTVGAAGSFNLDFVNGNWAEKAITANLAPALGPTIASSVPLTSANVHDYLLVDVTTAVQDWLNGSQANDGIALVANSPLNASFDSKENTVQSHPAELDIVFSGNGTITGVTTASGSGLTGGGTTGTLNLALTNACASGQVLQWNGSAWACASAGAGTVTSVGSGPGLIGGPISGSGTLSIAPGGVTNTMLTNPSVTVTAGPGLAGGGTVALGGNVALNLDTTKIPQLGAANTFTVGQIFESSTSDAIYAVQNATSGSIAAVSGQAASTSGYGVIGFETATSGTTFGVLGQSNSTSGYGVTGNANASTGTGIGVWGLTSSPSGYGVYGSAPTGGISIFSAQNLANAGDLRQDYNGVNAGGVTPGGIRFGVGNTGEGISSNRKGTTNQNGIDLYTNFTPRLSVTNAGNIGIGTTATPYQLEVDAQSYTYAIVGKGYNAPSGSNQYGNFAIAGYGGSGDLTTTQYTYGGYGVFGEGGLGVWAKGGFGGDGVGGSFAGGNNGLAGGGTGDGVLGYPGSGYAGNFNGNVNVAGNLSKSGGSFKIDHPLDPANKYLYHSFVESPDMMNVYNGNVVLDVNGEAVVDMPDWFETLNRDFRYQLTCIGGFAPVYVADEIQGNRFRIAGGRPGIKVSWQVTGIRQDPWANAHRIPVEEEKNAREQGFYIHPELYGAPEEKQVEWSRHPEMMRLMKQKNAKQETAPPSIPNMGLDTTAKEAR